MSKKKQPIKKEKKDLTLKHKKDLIEEGYIIDADEYSRYKDNRLKPLINCLREGRTDQEILIYILETFDVKESTANTYLRAAKSCFKQEMILDRKFNIVQHLKRYDRDINKLAEYQPKTNSYAQSIELKCRAYSDMVNMLQKKEKVLGFHQKSTQVRIKNNVHIQIKKIERTFTFDDLNWEEKIELFNLIKKCKVSEEEKFLILPNPKLVKDEIVEDIVHVVVEEIPNIDLIEHKDEIVEVNHDDKDYSQDKNVHDYVDKSTPRKTLDELKQSLFGK